MSCLTLAPHIPEHNGLTATRRLTSYPARQCLMESDAREFTVETIQLYNKRVMNVESTLEMQLEIRARKYLNWLGI